MTFRRLAVVLVAALISVPSGCATYDSLPYGEVVTMKAGEASSVSGFPPPGIVWRLDEADLKALSPAPMLDAPPPPRRPPPPVYYPPPPPPGWYGPPY